MRYICHTSHSMNSDGYPSALIFKDTSVELSNPDDCFLTEIAHLILQVSSNGEVLHHVNLLSRKSQPGVWDADEVLVVPEASGDFMISVSMVMDGKEHQLLSFMELSGLELSAELGKAYEIPLMGHEDYPSLLLKAKLLGFDLAQRRILGFDTLETSSDDEEGTLRRLRADGFWALGEYERQGNLQTLQQAIIQLQKASDMVSENDPRLPPILNNLGAALFQRFQRLGDIADINDSIARYERAISLISDDDPNKGSYLNNLGTSLSVRSERLENLADIEASIKLQRMASNLIPDSHRGKPMCLNTLGTSLHIRFDQLGNIADINDAIASIQAAVNLAPDSHPEKPMFLNNLGLALQDRFKRLGNLIDIDDAIVSNQAAANLTPDGHLERCIRLSNVGLAFHRRFRRLGNVADIDNAIAINQTTVDITPLGHPSWTRHLNNLGLSFQARFEQFGILGDVDNAITSMKAVVEHTPNGHPTKAVCLSNLGTTLLARFQRFSNSADIDQSIASNQAAVDLTPEGHPNKPMFLNNLGNSLNKRFDKFGKLVDLDDSIKSVQRAADLVPDNSPHKAALLSNLGGFFHRRSEVLGNIADADNAITLAQTAVDLTPEGHPEKPNRLNTLGLASRNRFFHSMDPKDAQVAISSLSSAATSPVGPPMHRFQTAKSWSDLASVLHHPSLMAAYECAIVNMSHVAWLGLPIIDRHQHLMEIGGITRDAAAAAISLEQYDKALEWLDQGRSIVWSQILQLRTPVDDLHSIKPQLAERLVQLSRLLDQGLSDEDKGREYRAIARERETIIEQVRSLPNFENFLRPPSSHQLKKAAQDGPVVVLDIAKKRCDTLALIPGLEDVIHIPLPNINSTRVLELGNWLKEVLFSSGIRMRGERAAVKLTNSDLDEEATCKQVLAELWTGVVKPVIDSLAFSPDPQTPARIWWCATGPLAFLPIHAAGIYDTDSIDSHLTDYAISSYIPTISVLLNRSNSAVEPLFKLLSVVQPSAPGVSSIPNTKEELDCIRRHLVNREHRVLEGTEGTKDRVMKGMKECNWLHLACHGVQRPDEPTKSALILEDGHLTLEEIIRLNLPNAEFAFLSACKTTAGDEKLSEEAVHIAGGMLLAGYRGVVATMWSIQDDLAPEVADEFYAHIMQDGGRPDNKMAAEALHISVQRLHLLVELSQVDDSFLTDVAHLIVEATLSGHVLNKVDLISRKSRPGVWDANQPLIVPEAPWDFKISVLMEVDGSERQSLGSIELNGPGFYGGLGKMYEIPLISHENYPNLVLKARILAFDYAQKKLLGMEEASSSSEGEDGPRKFHDDAVRAMDDYNRYGNLESLEHAIVQFQAASEMVAEGDPRLPRLLNSLGACLFRRFERFGVLTDIKDSIALYEKAIKNSRDDDDGRHAYFNNLGDALALRSERLGNPADIDEAMRVKRLAIDLTPEDHPNKPMYLNSLGTSFHVRFEQRGNVDDINNAITLLQTAIDMAPDGHPDKHMFLNNLGFALQYRFERLGNLKDIDNAIIANQTAFDLTPDGHPDKCIRLSNVGLSIYRRFQRLGNVADIDNAIATNQTAVDITPDGHPSMPVHLNNLASSLRARFDQLRVLRDIDSSIESMRTAIDLTPNDHPSKAKYLSNLGADILSRFQRVGNILDIDEAVRSNQAAVDLTPDSDPNKPMYLNNLGNSFSIRFENFKRAVDLDDAIRSKQMAITLMPDDHARKATLLSNLGGSLCRRFEELGNIADIDDAVTSTQRAIDLMPDGHPEKLILLNIHGSVLKTRFIHSQNLQDAQRAISSFSAAATSPVGPPMRRFEAANSWSTLAARTRHPSVLAACECVIALMRVVAWLGLPLTDRHQYLVEIGGATREAAATAISLQQYDKALEWLEQGRSIVWTQILQLRTPVDELRNVKPELAERLVQVSRLLDQGTREDGLSTESKWSDEEKGRHYRALTMERESIIEQVQSLPQFENFLKPLNSLQLMRAAQDGPVVVLNIAQQRCDALVLVPGLDDVVHSPLPNITSAKVSELGDRLKDVLFSSGIRMRGERAAVKLTDSDLDEEEACKQVLAELWMGVVKPVIDSLAFSPFPETLPRIWWCATGPLAFLPIHAAGIYSSDSVECHLTDYAISSYTPTLSALLVQSVESPFKLLSVIQPSAPGVSSIPNTKDELECIQYRLAGREHIVLEGADGTKDRVMKEMEDCNWLHLACHGIQKPDEPTKSALILEDGHLTLEEIIRLNLPKAQFAFLSACQTTAGDEKLSEEAVHIAGGMLLAGYRGTVATMWSIQDDLAPAVVDEFYAHILRDGEQPDGRRAAEALHNSVQKLRKRRNIPLTAWIPFVHLGV
ncbi:hypothetical protein CPB86DRAFT_875429 [Serendipita vermifera]|nr:hypothetical protein CPB86DRAFT_875429 [Serendipita vermifera]